MKLTADISSAIKSGQIQKLPTAPAALWPTANFFPMVASVRAGLQTISDEFRLRAVHAQRFFINYERLP
jgi:hypothetical protein